MLIKINDIESNCTKLCTGDDKKIVNTKVDGEQMKKELLELKGLAMQ